MRLFISYARVDKYICSQIVDILEVHEVWFDNRLHVGQHWWSYIQRQLEWCEGFIYLLSPDSVTSEYCLREYEIAKSLGKHIFPILIYPNTPIPQDLLEIQYVDISTGITTEEVKLILNSIYIAERMGQQVPAAMPVNGHGTVVPRGQPASYLDAESLISEAADALDAEEYDRAVYLLKQARASKFESRYVDLDAMLYEAENALEMQAYYREAEVEYAAIAALLRHDRTYKLGSQAFRAFHKVYPDYDPENLATTCLLSDTAWLEWCSVPAGEIRLRRNGKIKTYWIHAFEIGKYPVTNDQYIEFLDAPDGYQNENWWNFSVQALRWRRSHSEPLYPRSDTSDHPCVNVCWYEAVAFCRWISEQTGMTIALPTEQQWQRAAQGNDGRLYPWGDVFDIGRANTRESGIGQTVPVTCYPNGASPFEVWDMAGNAWEWCVNPPDNDRELQTIDSDSRVIRGGSYIGVAQRAQNAFYYSLSPACRYATIGFRLVRLKA